MKKKRKTRKLSLVAKQMMLIGLVVWISIGIIIAIVTNTRKDDMIEIASEECLSVSTLLSAYVDPDAVAQAGENEAIYDELKAQLAQSMIDAHMEYVYTLWTDGTTIYYGVDGSTVDCAEYGEESGEDFEFLAPAFAGTAVIDNALVQYEDGNYYITAYVPLVSEDGSIKSVLACDFNANHVQAKIVKAWTWLFIWSSIGTLLASTTVFLILRNTVKNIITLNDKVDELVYSNGDLTKTIIVKSGDELENLTDSINSLMQYIREIVVNIANNSVQVNSASFDMAKNLSTAQNSITSVSAAMEEMSAGMEETNAALTEIAENVNSIYHEIVAISDKSGQSAGYCDEVIRKG